MKHKAYIISVILALAALLLSSCAYVKKSPVGRSKVADSVRESLSNRPAKKSAAAESSEEALSAGLTGRISAATSETSTVSENTLTDGDPD